MKSSVNMYIILSDHHALKIYKVIFHKVIKSEETKEFVN
jgi:hypothetical protein